MAIREIEREDSSMKNILLITVLGGGLVLPQAPTSPPLVPLASVPPTIQPVPQVGIIVPAIVIGGGVLAIGWAGIKILNGALHAWEFKLTNTPPDEVRFTFAEDEYPGE